MNTQGSVYLNTSSDTVKFLIDTSVFNNCSNNKDGGCINYANSGAFVQDRVCSFSTTVNLKWRLGVYCKIDVSDYFKNHVQDSSICNTGNEYHNGVKNIFLINGQIQLKSINILFSKIDYGDFYDVHSYSNGSNSSYCTFSNSTSSIDGGNYKIRHFNSQNIFEIQNCNILNNKNGGILQADSAIVYIKNSSFIRNYPNGYFLYFSQYNTNPKITLDGCFIDDQHPKQYLSVIFTNNKTETFSNNLSHFSSAICHADNPIIFYVKEQTDNKNEIDLINFSFSLINISCSYYSSSELFGSEIHF